MHWANTRSVSLSSANKFIFSSINTGNKVLKISDHKAVIAFSESLKCTDVSLQVSFGASPTEYDTNQLLPVLHKIMTCFPKIYFYLFYVNVCVKFVNLFLNRKETESHWRTFEFFTRETSRRDAPANFFYVDDRRAGLNQVPRSRRDVERNRPCHRPVTIKPHVPL